MNKEEFDMLVNDILKIPQPKEELTASAMCSINVDELRQVIETFNKIPDYNLLIKDNLKKDKEIQRLNEDYKDLSKDYYKLSEDYGKQEKANKKLNNIIEELENFISTYAIPEFNISEEPTRYFMETKVILDKLKELKEGK